MAYARASGLRSFVTVLSPAPALFLAIFLFFSPVSDLTFASGSAETANVSSHVPVVMVVFDEVSTIAFEDADERIDPVLYPNLAALAKDATWFRYATAPTDMTGTATPTILTGSVAERYHPPILSSYPRNLFTLLGGQYRMKVSQEATDLCPRDLCEDASGESAAARDRALASDLGLVYLHVIAPDGIERDLPSVSDTVGNFGSDTGTTKTEGSPGHTGRVEVLHELGGGRPARFENFVRSIDRTARPTLYYKHSLLPHVPFQYFPDGHRYRTQPHDVIPGLIDEPSWNNEYLLQQAYQRHLLQAGFADRLLGTLLRRLHEKGLYDRALIVVTADNGESFLHRDANRHLATPGTVEDIADTPLFIKRPFEHAGRISTRHVRTEDILPSIADVLGIDMPWRVDGSSVFDSSARIPTDVDVFMRSGRRLRLSLPEFKRRIRASLARKIRLFGEHGRPPGLFGIGPHPELIGRPVSSVRARARERGDQRRGRVLLRAPALRLPPRSAQRHDPRPRRVTYARPGGRARRPDRGGRRELQAGGQRRRAVLDHAPRSRLPRGTQPSRAALRHEPRRSAAPRLDGPRRLTLSGGGRARAASRRSCRSRRTRCSRARSRGGRGSARSW